MKRHVIFITLVALVSFFVAGCQNPDGTFNNTGSGTLMGGALGAMTGAAIGGPHHGGQDALIGAAVGALASGLIGNSMDREQEARLRALAPQTYARVDQGQPLSLADVKALAKAGISEDVIINQIKSSHTVFRLSAADIVDLRDAGVSDKVLSYMINTPNTAGELATPSGPLVIPQAPPVPPVETVGICPGPSYVWVGGEWEWNGRWIWVGGHWRLPPYPDAVWVGGRCWRDQHGWHNQRGHWR